MVELTSFSTLGKIQPFLVTISSTAALLVDLHCHLSDKEVCGYLGGHWDINTHSNKKKNKINKSNLHESKHEKMENMKIV